MKKHLLLALLCGGAIVGGSVVGVSNQVKTHQEIIVLKSTINNETQDEQIAKLKEKITELLNSELVRSIVSYTTALSGVIGFVVTFFKYRKYKSISSTEIAELVSKITSENMSAKYEELETKVVKELINKFNSVEEALNVLQTFVALSQDKTKQGQLMLMEYLSSKVVKNTDNEEVTTIIEKNKEKLEEEIKKEDEVLQKVEEEYSPVE